ncbi:MAG: hypothetical protein Q9191_007980, partial [Dirinaria sp. TL-2023a]
MAHSMLEYKKWVHEVQTANGGQIGAQIGPVAYNLNKEAITLTGYSPEAIEQARQFLQKLLVACSEHWVSNPLKNSSCDLQHEPPRSREDTLSSSRQYCDGITKSEKIFPIKPKDHRRLVGVWFKHILPALPEVLTQRVGETYTASLVRRGEIDIRAKPCIEIESPCVPALKNQKIIKEKLDDICARGNYQESIRVHFSQGSVRQLIGGGEKDDDNNAQDDEDNQRFQFNMTRPYSKPRMGASLGLLCSHKIIGTLGGYVYVDGEKYMLTSEHFVARSQELENRHPEYRNGDQDLETLISPSRFDLTWIHGNLQQTLRDLHSEQRELNTYLDPDMPTESIQPQEKVETSWSIRRTETLLGEVT